MRHDFSFFPLLHFVLFFCFPLLLLSFFIYYLLFIFVSFSPARSLLLLCLFVCFLFFFLFLSCTLSSSSLFLFFIFKFLLPLLHTVFFHCCCVVDCVNLICGIVVLSLKERRGRWDG